RSHRAHVHAARWYDRDPPDGHGEGARGGATMNEIELFEQAVDGLLRDLTLHRDPLDPAPFDREAWVALERGGYTAVGLPEDLDGSGGSVLHCTALARLVGRHAIAAPVVESSFTASWLLSRGGLRRLAGVVTVGGGNHHDALSVVRA